MMKIILILSGALLLANFLFPPWIAESLETGRYQIGRHWVLGVPEPQRETIMVDSPYPGKGFVNYRYTIDGKRWTSSNAPTFRIDKRRLLEQSAILFLLLLLLALIARKRKVPGAIVLEVPP